MSRVNLVRPDGKAVSVDPDKVDVAQLVKAGWRLEGGAEAVGRVGEEAEKEYYERPGQRLGTLAEGAWSGLTFGLGNFLTDSEDTRKRARYNPGYRVAGEILGAVGGGIGTGALAGVRTIRGMAALGAAEGALAGAGGEVTNHLMTGDPLTVEGVAAGVGLGGLLGMGAGALGGGLSRMGGRAAKRLEQEALEAAQEVTKGLPNGFTTGSRLADDALEGLTSGKRIPAGAERGKAADALIPKEAWGRVTASVSDARTLARDMVRGVSSELDSAKRLEDLKRAGKLARGRVYAQKGAYRGASEDLAEMDTAFNALRRAHASRDVDKIAQAEKIYTEQLVRVASRFPGGMPDVAAHAARSSSKLLEFGRAVDDLAELMPGNAQEFLNMSATRAEKLFSKFDEVLGVSLPEAKAAQDALRGSFDDVAKALGMAPGDPRKLWATAHEAQAAAMKGLSAASQGTQAAQAAQKKNWFDRLTDYLWRSRLAGYGAAIGGATGLPLGAAVGAGLGWQLGAATTRAGALVGARAAATNRVLQAAKLMGKAGPAVRVAGPRVHPLARSLEGVLDSREDPRELYKARSKEIRELAGQAGQTRLFQLAMELTSETQPEVAHGLFKFGGQVLASLMKRLPAQPVGVQWGFSSEEWVPPDEVIEAFAQVYQAHEDPVGFLEWASENPEEVSLEAVQGLSEAWPEIYAVWRAEAVRALSERGDLSDAPYETLHAYSVLLMTPFVSTMTPEFIAAQQAMFMKPPPQPQVKPGSGSDRRPEGPSQTPDSTLAQRLDAR